MFTTLLESRATRTRRPGGTVVSALLHGAIIAAIAAVSVTNDGGAAPRPEKPPVITYVPIERPPLIARAPEPIAAAPSATQLQPPLLTIVAPTIIPTTLPPIDIGAPEIPADRIAIGRPGLLAAPSIGAGQPLGRSGDAVDAAEVERVPSVIGNATPRYPSMLREAGVSGQVVARFVIDTLGRAELGDVTIVEASHTQFAEAVRNALPQFRFTPGEIGRKKVRTMVQMPFTFAIK